MSALPPPSGARPAPPFPLAPLPSRILAGALDAVFLLSLCAGLFLVPLLTRGLVLPMWGVLLAVVGYAVVPLSAFRATLGMRLFGLELVSKDGHAVGPGDVLFRELVGRGFFPAAFLFTQLMGLVAGWLGVAAMLTPGGVFGFFFLVSTFTVFAALVGHLLVLGPEQRGLADLLARSHVRARQPRPAPDDEDDRRFRAQEHKKKVLFVIAFEGALFTAALFLPWVLTQKTESTEQRAERMTRAKLEAQHKQNPDDEVIGRQLADAYWRQGMEEDARRTEQELREAKTRRAGKRLELLRSNFKAEPKSDETFGALLEALEERGETEEAIGHYQTFLQANGNDPGLRAGFGHWLWNQDRNDAAVVELQGALAADSTLPGVQSMLGLALHEQGKCEQAQEPLFLALLEDPEDEQLLEAQRDCDAAVKPLPKKRQQELKKAFEGR